MPPPRRGGEARPVPPTHASTCCKIWRILRASASICFRLPTVSASSCSALDRKSTRLNSSHGYIAYAVLCLQKKNRLGPPTSLPPLPSSAPRFGGCHPRPRLPRDGPST